jgi:hypothetical protein
MLNRWKRVDAGIRRLLRGAQLTAQPFLCHPADKSCWIWEKKIPKASLKKSER